MIALIRNAVCVSIPPFLIRFLLDNESPKNFKIQGIAAMPRLREQYSVAPLRKTALCVVVVGSAVSDFGPSGGGPTSPWQLAQLVHSHSPTFSNDNFASLIHLRLQDEWWTDRWHPLWKTLSSELCLYGLTLHLAVTHLQPCLQRICCVLLKHMPLVINDRAQWVTTSSWMLNRHDPG